MLRLKNKAFVLSLFLAALLLFSSCVKKEEISYLPEKTDDKIITFIPEKEENKKSPQEEKEEKAEELLSQMSLEEKVGQMFFARCPDINAVEDIEEYHIGGYILFGRDFENKTPAQVKENIKNYQEASAKIPLLIGVDEEGGRVVRASKYKAFRDNPFPSPRELYSQGGLEAIKADTAEKAEFLKDLGINVNLAPVCDVSQNPNDYIYSRTLGEDGETTAEYISLVVEQMKEKNMGSVLKHFPGYGNNSDTHTGVAYDSRSLEEFESQDFLPFKAGIISGADSVLVSHNVMESVDNQLPASLSAPVHNILRQDLGFDGVIMTDDTAMEGIKNFTEIDTAVLAVISGNDIIITSDHKQQIDALISAIKIGEISSSRLDESVRRILIWKINIGLIK